MKRVFCTVSLIMFISILTGCSVALEDSQPSQSQESSAAQFSQESEEAATVGTTETFTQGELILEVSQVKSVRTENKLLEGIEPFEETIFTCYPGATLTISMQI